MSDDVQDVLLVVESLGQVFDSLYDFVRAHYRSLRLLMPADIDVWAACTFQKSGRWLSCSEMKPVWGGEESDTESDSESEYDPDADEYEYHYPSDDEDSEEEDDDSDSDYEPSEDETEPEYESDSDSDSDYNPAEDAAETEDDETISIMTPEPEPEILRIAPGAPRKTPRKTPRKARRHAMFEPLNDGNIRITIEGYNNRMRALSDEEESEDDNATATTLTAKDSWELNRLHWIAQRERLGKNPSGKSDNTDEESEDDNATATTLTAKDCFCMLCEAEGIPAEQIPTEHIPAEALNTATLDLNGAYFDTEYPYTTFTIHHFNTNHVGKIHIYWSTETEEYRVYTYSTGHDDYTDAAYYPEYIDTMLDMLRLDLTFQQIDVHIPCFPRITVLPHTLANHRDILMRVLGHSMDMCWEA
jgi:hypothetical protein